MIDPEEIDLVEGLLRQAFQRVSAWEHGTGIQAEALSEIQTLIGACVRSLRMIAH